MIRGFAVDLPGKSSVKGAAYQARLAVHQPNRRIRVREPNGSWCSSTKCTFSSAAGRGGGLAWPARCLAYAWLGLERTAQRASPEGNGVGPQLITVGGGPGNIEQQVASIDFAQLALQAESRRREESERERLARAELVESGAISQLDLAAPPKSIREYNAGITLLKNQHSSEAIEHLQKAVALYPKFVSAHNALGLAFMDMDDTVQAKSEFEIAVQFDQKYARSLLNLGQLAISNGDFPAAEASLEKANSVRPNDAEILTALAYAQYGNHEYQQAIQTVLRVHDLSRSGTAGRHGNAHYVAAAAGLALQDGAIVERELALFIEEDPMNPLVPVARHNLELLTANKKALAAQQIAASQKTHPASNASPSLADNARLKSELSALSEGPDKCDGCEQRSPNPGVLPPPDGTLVADLPSVPVLPSGNAWTIRKVVDEVALFFAVSSHGHMVDDLKLSEIQVRDDGKPPAKILLFAPQSKLPLRVGCWLIPAVPCTSGLASKSMLPPNFWSSC